MWSCDGGKPTEEDRGEGDGDEEEKEATEEAWMNEEPLTSREREGGREAERDG